MDILTRPFIDEDVRLEHSLELAALTFGSSSLEFASACLDLSDVYAASNMNLHRATVLAQHALDIRTLLLGQHDAATAIAASRLAILLHMTNRHAEAQNVETFANESVEAVCENTGRQRKAGVEKSQGKSARANTKYKTAETILHRKNQVGRAQKVKRI
ncbi:hypothetical protein NFJ02_36g91930 [Pycnococcus provasolii]